LFNEVFMHEKLSLLKYCIPCKAKCCKTGRLIGSPILSRGEISRIEKTANRRFKKITSPAGEDYFIIREQKRTKRCFFLTEENKCYIQNKKPLDCLCYPVKAIYDNHSIKFMIDNKCPAARHLSKKFLKNAKITALKSIKRFNKLTYEHWLDNYVGWVKIAQKKLKYCQITKSIIK